MTLTKVMLNERNQTPKSIYHALPFKLSSRQAKLTHSAQKSEQWWLRCGEYPRRRIGQLQVCFRYADVFVLSWVQVTQACSLWEEVSSCNTYNLCLTQYECYSSGKQVEIKMKKELNSCKPKENKTECVYQGGQVNYSKHFC